MNKIAAGITRHKKLITILFICITAVCLILQFGVIVDFNMVDYLPENAQSTKALSIMDSEFKQAVPNARVMLKNVTIEQALDYKHQIEAIDGVSDVLWLDDIIDLKTPIEAADQDTVQDYYKDGNALISFTMREGDEVAVSKAVYAVIGENNAFSGNALDIANIQQMASSETTKSVLILVPMIILILLISTGSWLEPLLFLSAIGVSVLINMGLNIFSGKISFVTYTVSPVLQLAVSMDYAIFLLRSFDEYRATTSDVDEAMRLAMKRAFTAIFASASTTLFGFMALIFMQFRLGADLGLNLMKGIVFSYISVMVFLPALTLCCYKLIDKTKHKRILPEFKNIGKYITKFRIPAMILVALLIIPCFLAQGKNSFTYGYSTLSSGRSENDRTAINAEFGQSTAVVLLVPKGDSGREKLLCDDLGRLEHVNEVISYVTVVGSTIPEAYLDSSITGNFYSENYCRIILYTDAGDESKAAFSLVEQIESKAKEYYGDTIYTCGQSAALYDMKNVIEKDNKLVNYIAIGTILLVLILSFRSATLPVLLVITIEAAIWMNLSFPYFSGNPLCYIGYLIISTVQLGATVDYAILTTDHYLQNRKTLPAKEAILKTYGETFRPILISASILSFAGFCLWFISSNSIVSQLGLLLGRGTLLSMLLVVCFLPAVLVLFDKVIGKTTHRTKFYREM